MTQTASGGFAGIVIQRLFEQIVAPVAEVAGDLKFKPGKVRVLVTV
jgi:hypothetical protein